MSKKLKFIRWFHFFDLPVQPSLKRPVLLSLFLFVNLFPWNFRSFRLWETNLTFDIQTRKLWLKRHWERGQQRKLGPSLPKKIYAENQCTIFWPFLASKQRVNKPVTMNRPNLLLLSILLFQKRYSKIKYTRSENKQQKTSNQLEFFLSKIRTFCIFLRDTTFLLSEFKS